MRTTIAAGVTLAIAGLVTGAPASAKCELAQIIELPVTMNGLRPMVASSINGRKTEFVADSGAFFSIISPGTAASDGLRLRAAPDGFRVSGIGGDADVSIATVKDFGLVGHALHNIEFLVGGSAVGGGAGLIGQNILGIADADYDLAHGAIRLIKPKGCGNSDLAYWTTTRTYSIVDLDWQQQGGKHIQGTVTLNGIRLSATFDTGAPTSILSSRAAARAGVKPGGAGVTDAGRAGGLGRNETQSWIGPFASLKIGDNEEIRNIHLRFADIGDTDMLIGADFFLSHRIYVGNAEHKMFVTYNGGPVFDLSVHHDSDVAAAPDTPAPLSDTGPAATETADQWSRDGAALAARQQYPQALADLDRACALAPDNARYRYQRASIEIARGDHVAALADLDHALHLEPGDVAALMLRTGIELGQHDLVAARRDADALATLLPKPADDRFKLAQFYDVMQASDAAEQQYGLWIDTHRDDSRLPIALNDRCWLRAMAGADLSGAIDDCNRAIRMRPHVAGYLDSRGLARLRSGDIKDAIRDYDAALALDSDLPWSLYGRGLARHLLGQAAAGDADVAAAERINHVIVKEAAAHGITPAALGQVGALTPTRWHVRTAWSDGS